MTLKEKSWTFPNSSIERTFLILVFKNFLLIRKFIVLFDFYLLNLISFSISLSFRRDIASFVLTRRKVTINQSINQSQIQVSSTKYMSNNKFAVILL